MARLEQGAVVLPALADARAMPAEEWDALGPDEDGRGEESHPQYHLKRLLDRIGVGAGRGQAVARRRARGILGGARAGRGQRHGSRRNSATNGPGLSPPERRLTGIRVAELPDPASEAQAIAIALREAVETPGKTAALVTPDRDLAARVSAHLQRWGIEADDSAGQPLSQAPAGTLLLAIAAAAVENLAPVPLLALLKHPLVGGEGDERLAWLEAVRALDLALRGPRPRAGHRWSRRAISRRRRPSAAWHSVRPSVAAAR